MNNIHLYIGNLEVEFIDNPEILYTYQVDDLTNPTVVKNSFSKTITIKGTRNNNHLFGHYWNIERTQVGAGGGNNGASVYYNPSKKMDFSIYVGSELYEQGYVKLDEVRKEKNNYEYDITLYGGLGDFFYNLSITDNGDEMKLSDLNFENDIDFTIDINTVKDAWESLKNNKKDKWQTINFMPAYNGFPDDFDSDKILIDTKSTNLTKSKTEDGKTYKTKENWTMAELPEDMTEWEVRDLRTYLQRPCLRVKDIILACCKPENNGGYEVELDADFFNENNPYWENTWMTLPMIQALEYDSGEQTLNNSRLMAGTTEGNVEGYMYQPLSFDMGEFPSSVVSSINITASIDCGLSLGNTSYMWFWNKGGDSYHSGWACFGSLYCQLLAFNGDKVVGASSAYNLTTPVRHNGKLYYGHSGRYSGGHQFTPYMSAGSINVLGRFEKGKGFVRENETNPALFNFFITGLTTNVTELKMCYYWGASKDKLKKADAAFACFDKSSSSSWVKHSITSTSQRNVNAMTMDLKGSSLKAVMGGTIGRTGTNVTKQLLLNTEASPCDYLLSYCKMYGLYFSKSLYKKHISIETRKTFYNREKVIDISKDIDYSKGVTIAPIAFNSKWVEFAQEQDETKYVTEYKTTKGIIYGSKVLNTGYEFDSEKKQLLEGNVFKSAIEGLERSKYFTCYNNDSKVRPWFGMGMKYQLYNGDDTIEVYGSNSVGSNLLGINEGDGMKYYDLFPKIQFHSIDNKPTDGNNCLIFFSGFKNLTNGRANNINYFLTDDSYYQSQLNEGTPCWLFVSEDKDINEKPIARKLTEIPVFERYLTDNDGTTIKKSLDFGTAQELFIPNYGISEDVNIYNNFWKTYLEDLYDVNTKIMTVYMRLKGNVGYNLLRQFYWFENSIWRINKISDWNIGTEDTVKVEFVKVQDSTDYTTVTQTRANTIRLTSTKYKVDANGEEITITLFTENGGEWRIVSNRNNAILSKTEGVGNDEISLIIPQTETPSKLSSYTITAIDNEGNTAVVNIWQGYENETQFKVNPTKLIVPAIGGDYNISLDWVNQGDYDITTSTINGDVTGNVEIDGYNATIFVTESNEPDTIISGKVLFDNGLYNGEVLIDQIPSELVFGKDGGEYEFIFNYNTDVEYLDLPFWATVYGNTLKVLSNYYEVAREANITIVNSHSSARLRLKQEVGNSPAPETPKVTPNSLYFNKQGGVQLLSINIPNTWKITETLDWLLVNMLNGDQNSIVQITADVNNGNSRSGIITVTDILSREVYNVYVNQLGDTTVQSFSINPTDINATTDGGVYDITINYEGRNGDYVGVETELEHTDLLWVGDVATMRLTIPQNVTHSSKTFKIVFTSSIGNAILTVEQEGLEETLTVNKTTISSTMDGDSNTVTVNSNVPWYTSSDSWITVTPNTNEDGKIDIAIVTYKNPSTEDRTGYVYFKSIETDTILATVKVIQGKLVERISVYPSSISFDVEGGTATITISSNTYWNITI